MFFAFLNQTLPKAISALALILFIQLYGLESLSPYYKTVAAFTIIQLFAEYGVPAQYQRVKALQTDLKLYLRSQITLKRNSLIVCTILLVISPLFYFYIKNVPLVFFAIVFVYIKSFTALRVSMFAKRKRHAELFYINFISNSISLVLWLCAYLLSNQNVSIDAYVAVVLFFALPIIARYVVAKHLARRLEVSIKVPFILKQRIHTKMEQIRRVDLVRSLIGTGNSQLTILFSSILMNDADLALLGLLVTWGNRMLLLFISTLKQVTYPILVENKNNASALQNKIQRNYFLNLIYIFFLVLLIFAHWKVSENQFSLLLLYFTILSGLLFGSTPLQDALKARGYFQLIFKVSLIKIVILSMVYIYLYLMFGKISVSVLLFHLYFYGVICHWLDISFFMRARKIYDQTKL